MNRELAAAWFALTLATAFVLTFLTTSPAAIVVAASALAEYAVWLGPSAIAAIFVCALLAGSRPLLRSVTPGALALGAACLYLSALKAYGFELAPWVSIPLALAVVLLSRGVALHGSILVIHAAGTLAGFHLAFTSGRYAEGWRPLLDVLRSLRVLAGF